jgi:hypothetical protein
VNSVCVRTCARVHNLYNSMCVLTTCAHAHTVQKRHLCIHSVSLGVRAHTYSRRSVRIIDSLDDRGPCRLDDNLCGCENGVLFHILNKR